MPWQTPRERMPLIHTEETIARANQLMEQRIYGYHTFKELMRMSLIEVNQVFASIHGVDSIRRMSKKSALNNILVNRVVFNYIRNGDIPLDERNEILLKIDYIERFVLKTRTDENRGIITRPRVWIGPPEPVFNLEHHEPEPIEDFDD